MVMRSRITNAVNRVFDSVGDLAVEATLGNKTVTNYSFSTGEVTSNIVAVPTKAIITTTSRNNRGGSKIIAVIKSGTPVDIYDTLYANSILYNIESAVDNGYTIELNLVREAS
jgi:predicted ABC-type ATPase